MQLGGNIMPLQNIEPVASAQMDVLVQTGQQEWIQMDELAFIKVLYTAPETGAYAVVLKWLAGYSPGAHKHLAGGHTYMLSGKLQLRDITLSPGDYIYESNAVIHDDIVALEDSEFLFVSNGAIVFYDENGLTNYLSWEEIERLRESTE
ncbi:MAG: hypothetical protein ACI9UN_002301 [Granulosicoccus sp.]|jgi:hypothetical protein